MAESPEPKESGAKKGMGTGTKVLLGAIIIFVLLGLLAYFTVSIAVIEGRTGASFPFTTTYRLWLPDGQPVTIAGAARSLLSR